MLGMMGVDDDVPEDVLSAEEIEERRKRAEAEAFHVIQEEKERKAREEAAAAAAAQLRRQKEMVRSAAIGRRAQVSILMSEGAVPDFLFEVRRGHRAHWQQCLVFCSD